MSDLHRHVPRLALEWAGAHPDERWRRIDGTLCFADISGFTALAERLAQRGRAGGEELVETLGSVFADMLDIAQKRGGSLLKFGGDALLLHFGSEDHAVQAACAAVEMRQALKKAADMPTSVGRLRLSMSVGLHSGPADFFLVGGAHRELIVLGSAVDRVIEAENAANPREVVVSPTTAERLPRSATKQREDGAVLLRWRRAPVPEPAARASQHWDPALVRSLFPASLGAHLESGPPDPEHRIACIAFVRFSGTDALLGEQGPEQVAAVLDETVGVVQKVLAEEGVTLLAIDVDRDGGKFFLGAGIPHGHEDDEGVMLRALRRVMDANLPLPLQAGVSRGHVFAAEVGSSRRAAFSAMGDTTNTAARIAAQAPPGTIYVHPAVLDECLTRFEVTQAGPLTMKGKAAPQPVYAVGDELGLREREGLEVDEMFGREEELSRLDRALAEAGPDHGRVICISGAPGVGKSRLLSEFVARFDPSEVMALRAEPYGAANPYRMFRDPLRQLAGVARSDTDTMIQQFRVGIGEMDPELEPWLALLADVAQLPIGPSPQVAALSAEFRPARTAEAMIRVLELRHPGRLVITVEDAQWCDDASAAMLSRLADACADRPWLVISVSRDPASGFSPGAGVHLALEPLAHADIRRLVHAATEAAPLRPQVIDRIVRRAAGHPRFAIELIRAVRDIGSFDALPESIEGALAAQIAALDQSATRVLHYGSVLGRSFSTDVLANLFAAEDQTFDESLLDRLGRFLEEEQPGRFRFRNAMLRDALYEELAYRQRRRLHRAAAEALQRRTADPTLIAHDLALHASRGEEFDRALEFALLAGRRAKAAYANAEAVQNFEIALAAGRRLEVPARQVVEIFSEMGESLERAGFVEEALKTYRRGLRLARDEPVMRAELHCSMAWAKQRGGRTGSALRSVREGVKLAGSLDPTRAGPVLARLRSLEATIYFGQDRPGRALDAAERAIPVARAAGEKEALVRVLNIAATAKLVLTGKGDSEALEEALTIADSLDDRGLKAMLASTLSGFHFYENRWADAAAGYAEAHRLFEEAGNYLDGAYMLVNSGEILSRQGRLAEAGASLTEALRVMRAADFAEGIANSEMELARVAMLGGELDTALDLARRSAAEFERLEERHFVLQARLIEGEALLRQGRSEEALRLTDEAIAGAGGEAVYLTTTIATARARALLACGRPQEAAVEVEKGLAAADEQDAVYDRAMLLRLRDELARARGQEAADDAAEADRLLAELGAVV